MTNPLNPPKKQNYCLKDSKGRIVETLHSWSTATQWKTNLKPIYGDLILESMRVGKSRKNQNLKA